MKVIICSRQELECLIKIGFPEKTVLIRFDDCTEVGDVVEKKGYIEETTDVFEIELDDIDWEELEELGFSIDTFFPEAEELARFIYHAYDKNLNIICQCEYGQSRSAGCAAAILEHFYKDGISIFRDYRYFPNKMIFNKVYESLQAVKENRE